MSLEHKLVGFSLFLLITLLLIVIPLEARLDVEDEVVRTRLFGFRLLEIRPSDVQVMSYGNLFRGSWIWKRSQYSGHNHGKSKSASIGEKLYGKEAVAHAKCVLER